jgi:plastocyanin
MMVEAGKRGAMGGSRISHIHPPCYEPSNGQAEQCKLSIQYQIGICQSAEVMVRPEVAIIKHSIYKAPLKPERLASGWIWTTALAMLLSLVICSLSVSSCALDAREPTISTGHDLQEQPNADQSEEHFISIGDSSFNPYDITINRGASVTWINDDATRHSIVSLYHFQDEDDVSHIFLGETWVSGDIMPGQSFTRVFDESGVFKYFALPIIVPTPMDQYYAFSQVGIGVVTVK